LQARFRILQWWAHDQLQVGYVIFFTWIDPTIYRLALLLSLPILNLAFGVLAATLFARVWVENRIQKWAHSTRHALNEND